MEMETEMIDCNTDNEPELQPKEKLVEKQRTGTEEKEEKPEQEQPLDEVEDKEIDENKLMNIVRDGLYNFTLGKKLGNGTFGCIYAAVRKSDGKQVALKIFLKNKYTLYITPPGDTRRLPAEVALLELVCKPPRCPYVIELLEWFELRRAFILVLERPDPCVDLFDHMETTYMSESEIRLVMKQIVLAACHCRERGVLHRDIKSENILFNPHTCEVKLIDFGCGDLHKDTIYKTYSGTQLYIPPEVYIDNGYKADSSTVWGLGILLYSLIYKQYPFSGKEEIVKGHVYYPFELSKASIDLISWCLERNPNNRPTLNQILEHHWFQDLYAGSLCLLPSSADVNSVLLYSSSSFGCFL
ncbi:serine/threonine-protein kinase pim-1-like isoform X2 [Silurus meridionalis]|uniref:serine/threonine-protein kinase pim-1-like isoform X2 n=1 Tax=Silurus meridionalis TaxID=175797 RepID=UPI001EECE65F|nr:serine/threonine-protein kinase pim-1-like isoform X2 [Silurus meridionalis]